MNTSGSGNGVPTGTSAGPFKQLARLVVRAFYNGPCPPKTYRDVNDVEGARSKLGKVDTTGLGIILIDYLLQKEWVGEAEIVDQIKVHHKLIRRALKYLEREQLLMSEHRRETRRGQKKDVVKAVMDANAEAEKDPDEDEEAAEQLLRPHTISYYAVDFPRMFDMLQLRLHHMKKMLKDELDSKEVLAKYLCSAAWCAKEYDSLEVHWLVKGDGDLHCDLCDNRVLPVLASGQTGDDLARRERRTMISSRLTRMESQLSGVLQRVSALKSVNPPFYGTLREWAVAQQQLLQRQQAQAGQGGRGGGPGGHRWGAGAGMPGMLAEAAAANANYWQDTQVEVNLAGGDAAEGAPAAAGAAAAAAAAAGGGGDAVKPAVLPPWMLRPGANAGGSALAGLEAEDAKDGKKANGALAAGGMGEEDRKQAYLQAYMAMLAAQQAQKEAQQQQGLNTSRRPEPTPSEQPPPKRVKQEQQQQAAEEEQQQQQPVLPAQVAGVSNEADVNEMFEWEDAAPAAAPELPAASPAMAGDEEDWEDI